VRDDFADQFSRNVRFRWPNSLHDATTQNAVTGSHTFSPAFSDHLSNYSSWALPYDFFVKFPEIIGLVPIDNPIPRSLPLAGGQQNQPAGVNPELGVCDWPDDWNGMMDTGWMS